MIVRQFDTESGIYAFTESGIVTAFHAHPLVMLKILLPTLAGSVSYFLIGWLVFEGLLGQYMSDNTLQLPGFRKGEAEASMVLVFVSCAAYALLLTLVFGQWSSVHTFQEGAIKGAILGMLVAVMANTYWYASTHFFNSWKPLLADVLAAGLTVGLMGGVIAAVLGYLVRQ
jgi:hypothetical protein